MIEIIDAIESISCDHNGGNSRGENCQEEHGLQEGLGVQQVDKNMVVSVPFGLSLGTGVGPLPHRGS